MTRAEKHKKIVALREQGVTWAEIAKRFNRAISSVRAIYDDPDLSKQRERRRKYEGVCGRCGGPTKYSGLDHPSPHCAACAAEIQKETRTWTPEAIIERFQEFHRVTGRSPAVTDIPHHAELRGKTRKQWHLTSERIAEATSHGIHLPTPSIVQREFGGWRKAVEAAGLVPVPWGLRARRNPYPERVVNCYWTPETVIAALQEAYAQLGRTPTHLEMKGSLESAMLKCFGGYPAAREAAGIPQPGGRGWHKRHDAARSQLHSRAA
jgi:hypothetical protein